MWNVQEVWLKKISTQIGGSIEMWGLRSLLLLLWTMSKICFVLFFFFWSVCGSEACLDPAKDFWRAGDVVAMAMDISMDQLIEIVHWSGCGCGHFFVYWRVDMHFSSMVLGQAKHFQYPWF